MIVLKVNIGTKQLEKKINALRSLPILSRKMMSRWGEKLAQSIRDSAKNSDLERFKGGLTSPKLVYWQQKQKSNVGQLIMPDYAVMIDRMKPHWVTVRKTRPNLLAWSRQSKSRIIRWKGEMVAANKRKRFGVYVSPHPFIDDGYRRARKLLPTIIRQELKKI